MAGPSTDRVLAQLGAALTAAVLASLLDRLAGIEEHVLRPRRSSRDDRSPRLRTRTRGGE